MFILILTIISLHGAVSTTTQEFSYEANCTASIKATQQALTGKVQSVTGVCTPK